MPRMFHSTDGRVFRAVLTFTRTQADGSESEPLTQHYGPYTRQLDASATLTRESGRYGRNVKSAHVEVGTTSWSPVATRKGNDVA